MSLQEVLIRAKAVVDSQVASGAQEVDAHAAWPEASLRALQGAGLGGLVVPERHGGLGYGLRALVEVSELIGRECASTAMCFGMHHVGAAVLSARATERQRRDFLEPIVRGEHLTTLALSEPGTGAHFYLPQTLITMATDGSLTVDGQKTFITNGGHADSYVLSGRVVGDPLAAGEFACVVVPANTEGLTWGDHWKGLGMRGNASRAMRLPEVRLSPHALLGRVGDQTWYVFRVVAPYFLAAMTGTYLGVAARAVEEVRLHLLSREHDHSATRLAELPMLQAALGELWGGVEAARALAYSASSAFDRGDPNALPAVLSSKAEVANVAVKTVNEALTLCGGIAYRENSTLARLLRDARAAHVMSPTTQLLRIWTGRILLEQPILGD